MAIKFRNKSGLTAYALACGHVQQVEAMVNGRVIRVTLWQENGAYHVRAHDFTEVGRLDWIAESSLTDARLHFVEMCRKYLGDAINKAKKDKRVKISREFSGDAEPSYVARFNGAWIGKSETRIGALVVAFNDALNCDFI